MQLRRRLDPSSIDDDDEVQQPAENSKDRTAVLAIAYHNMGVEQEFLRSYPAAILSYKKAVNFAEKHLGAEDGITQNLRNVYENAKNELDVAVFKKKKAAGGSAGGSGTVKASKYYAGTKPKKAGNKQQDAYDNMMTPRNVKLLMLRIYSSNPLIKWRELMKQRKRYMGQKMESMKRARKYDEQIIKL